MDDAIAQQWTSSMSSSLPEGAAHAPLKIEARGSKARGLLFHVFGCRCRGGHSRPAHEVGGAQRRSRRLFLTVLHFVFVFSLGGPTLSEPAGGRPQTERSKTLGARGRWRRGPGALDRSSGRDAER